MSHAIFPANFAPTHPDRLQLYTMPTPNGQKASIALEELGMPYEAHSINILKGDQHTSEYLEKVNPNGKIPAIIDPDGPNGEPHRVFESGAILWYLANKPGYEGKLLPSDPARQSEVLQWAFFQVGSVGPMFGQFGHFYKFAKGKTDTYGEERYGKEVTRLLGVLDKRMDSREWLVGDYSIADIMTVPWMKSLEFYEGKDVVGYDRFEAVDAWVKRFDARPAVQKGSSVGSLS